MLAKFFIIHKILTERIDIYNMKFSQWFAENDQPALDTKKYYLACVLPMPVRNQLKAFVESNVHIPPNWTFKTHHLTVKFNLQLGDVEKFKNLFRQDVSIRVKALGWDEDKGKGIEPANCIAAVVEATVEKTNEKIPVDNAIAHITIAHSHMVKPFYSNQMLADNKNIRPNTASAVQYNSIFCAVDKFNEDKFWPADVYNLIYGEK